MIRFFLSGYNKSGTTFLQMLLDGHPTVHCPSEQFFNLLLHFAEQLSNEYKKQLAIFDQNTARQGIQFDKNRFVTSVVQSAVSIQMDTGIDKNTTHTGLNDNSIINDAPYWAQMFPHAHFIFIVRDPRALAVSIWHHRIRTEPEFAKSGATIDAVAGALAKSWPDHVDKLVDFKDANSQRVSFARFEDLIGNDRLNHMENLLHDLKVEADRPTVEKMFERVDFAKLKQKESSSLKGESGFYRQGNNQGWKEELKKNSIEAFTLEAGRQLELFQYL